MLNGSSSDLQPKRQCHYHHHHSTEKQPGQKGRPSVELTAILGKELKVHASHIAPSF